MAKKDYAAELAELRAQLGKTEREKAALQEKYDRLMKDYEQGAHDLGFLVGERNAAEAEVVKVKAHAYDLLMKLQEVETA